VSVVIMHCVEWYGKRNFIKRLNLKADVITYHLHEKDTTIFCLITLEN